MKLSEKFFLDKHHKIERFGVMFGVLFLALLTVFVTTCFSQVDHNETLVLTQSKWSTEFSFSLSGASGSVVNVFRNSDNTKSFMLLYFNDLKDITLDPNQYEVFLTGSDLNQNRVELKCSPKAQMFTFGTTGYMGLYFVDMGGFEPQICDLIIRSNKLVSEQNHGGAEAKEDATFAQYDQAEIYFNPGGSDAIVSAALEENDMSPFSIYESMIAFGREDEIRNSINENLKAMHEIQLHMSEYEMRVSDAGIVVPKAPLPIRNDVVEGPDENGFYSLKTDFVYNRGFDFDWAYGSVRDGWLADICDTNNYSDFFREKSAMEEDTPFSLKDGTVKWYRTDGTEFKLNSSDDDVDDAAGIRKSIEDLTSLWSGFNELKVRHQTVLLKDMLMLEANARTIEKNCRIASDLLVTVW